MIMNTIDVSQYPTLSEEKPEFKTLVDRFANWLSQLSEPQKEKLAMLKAIELTNALVQTREKENAPNRLGREPAKASFQIVRAVLRSRQISLAEATISLKEPELRAIIDEACRLFHGGKKDPTLWEQAMALSTAQSIVLNPYLAKGLQQFHQLFQDLYPPEIMLEVTERYIAPYAV